MENTSENKKPSQFIDLYKISLNFDQNKRRQMLLNDQKRARENLLDNVRGLLCNSESSNKQYKKHINNKEFRNLIMYSEWFVEVPTDLDVSWFMKVCPTGHRNLVVAEKNTTKSFSKTGRFEYKFKSMLPGGIYVQEKMKQTILDCIWCSETNTFYVLDVLVWAGQDITNCDAEFRFFWLQSKMNEIPELEVTNSHNTYAFKYVPHFTCDYLTIKNEMDKYPYYENDLPGVDGILFYHKEASYTAGRTPLFGWLKPFMLPEIINVPAPQYNQPDDYTNIRDYIQQFKEQKRKNKLEKRQDKLNIVEMEM